MGPPRSAPALKLSANCPVKARPVESTDPFPKEFLAFLHAIPSTDSPDERPRKRARVGHVDTIPIARESLTLSQPIQAMVVFNEPISRKNVNNHMKLYYDEQHRILDVSSNPRSPNGSFNSRFEVAPSKLAKKLLTILEVLSRSRDKQDDEGALWVRMSIDLDRQQCQDSLKITFELNWNASAYTLRNASQRALSQPVLDTFFEGQIQTRNTTEERLLPQAFYDAAFTPEKDYANVSSITIPGLASSLYPFQHRALQWLLSREGVKWSDASPNGGPVLEPLSPPLATDLPFSFSAARDVNGLPIYVSSLYQIVVRDLTPFHESETAVKGGILAEEMGLGKTVETISLICMHKREGAQASAIKLPRDLRFSGATLIITPATLKTQWISEFSKHAPQLSVKMYDGMKGFVGDAEELISELAGQDVVITTYSVLQAEIHYTEDPPDRSMRHGRKPQRPKSPLIQISWWRVCIDEAQQIESGVSSAAKVARLIPRINAWGITGTPVKEDIKDLWGLLSFLHYEPFVSSMTIWNALITSYGDLFKTLFNRISLRHTKRAVRDELKLPSQKRYVITTPFSVIEEEHYRTHVKQLVQGLGLDEVGTPINEDWDPEDPVIIDQMKRTLAHLRQIVLHASLGPAKFGGGGTEQRKGPRTLEEVLDVMIEKSDSEIRNEQRNYLTLKIERGQVFMHMGRTTDALHIWKQVVDEVEVFEDECRKQLEDELEKAINDGSHDPLKQMKGHDSPNGDDTDQEKAMEKVNECRRKLRSLLYIHHRAHFFIASGYYQMKSNLQTANPQTKDLQDLEEKEVTGYETAKNIRKEILHEARTKALSSMTKIRDNAAAHSFVKLSEVKVPLLDGLENERALHSFELLSDALNAQAELVTEWREIIVQFLMKPLVDEEDKDEITGEEYEDSTQIQDHLMVYTLALRAVIADRQDAITGLENERVRYDTGNAQKQALNGEGHAPKKALELLGRRDQVKPSRHAASFRSIVTDLRELATRLRHKAHGTNRAAIEVGIVEKYQKSAQEQSALQSKAAIALERELDSFVTAMNTRVEYYKQLQVVSDMVTPLDVSQIPDLEEKAQILLRNIEAKQEKVASARPKHRYLLHVKKGGQNSEEICVICQDPFTDGVLTVCGHQFCNDCILKWFEAHHSCPVCKKKLGRSMLHNITLKRQELKLHPEPILQEQSQPESHAAGDVVPFSRSRKSGIYSEFSSKKLEVIKNIDLNGPSFATKIDTITKHLMWLRIEDPGAKSIIFSQFGGFLDILAQAFDQYLIGYTSFKKNNGTTRFKEDPAIECFLMDARAHASGLNLVNANHVFLCEPLLNTALELQAIARVDRIGQEHETTVWLYLIEGTVEESIYDLSVQRRLEHLGRNMTGDEEESLAEVSDMNLEVANSLELQQASLSKLMNRDQSLGEVVDNNDLWQCLFGHVSKNNPSVVSFLADDATEARGQDKTQHKQVTVQVRNDLVPT